MKKVIIALLIVAVVIAVSVFTYNFFFINDTQIIQEGYMI